MGARTLICARGLALALASALLLVALPSASARAESPWGSLGSFRIASGEGQTLTLKPEESAVAIDEKDGSFFVAFKPDEGSHEPLRVQRFNSKGEAGAKIEVKVPSEEKSEGELGRGVEAAFDPARNRVYVLVRWLREEENANNTRPAPERFAAGALYAFEYNSSNELVSLATAEGKKGEKVPAPILEKEGFKGQGEESKEPLLNPLGLAVDPTSGNVLVLGEQNESSSTQIKKEEEVCRAAGQWVKVEGAAPNVAGKLARRYVDNGDVLGKAFAEGGGLESEECGEEEEASFWQAYSPVLTPAGTLLAMSSNAEGEEGRLWEIPAAYAEAQGEASTTPKLLYSYDAEKKGQTQERLALETGAEEASEATSPLMSLVPSAVAKEGKLYVAAKYEKGASELAPSVLALKYDEEGSGTKVSELGWVGGYHDFLEKAETPQEIAAAACSLPLHGGGIPYGAVVLGGFREGQQEGVMAFKSGVHNELVGIRLGSGGSAATCTGTALESPKVKIGEERRESVLAGQQVTLESEVFAGLLESVEWQFKYRNVHGEEESEPTETGGALGLTATQLQHTFEHPGVYTVTERIKAFGNLAGPAEATATKVVKVTSNLKVQLTEVAPIHVGEAAHFEAGVNVPGGAENEKVEYEWAFGDGTTQGPSSAALDAKHEAHLSADHVFNSSCVCAVRLVVKSPGGEEEDGETSVSVLGNGSGSTGGGGGGGGSSSSGSSSSAGSGSTGTSPGQAGVKGATSGQGDPDAKLAASSLSVSPSGALTLKVSCPAGESTCTGTVSLKTLNAVTAAKGKKKKILTLARGSFAVAGGKTKAVPLHLNAKARALLAHSHVLHALATLLAHDTTGASRTVKAHVTLRLTRAHHKSAH
jgi:uncharacterized protein with GYD domain